MATNDHHPEVDPELEELIAGYVLDTLTPDERGKVETALSASQEARDLRRVYQETLGGYAALTPPRKAPAGGEAKLRARLAAEPRRPAAPLPPHLSAIKPTAPPVQAAPRRASRRLRPLYVALAALLLIVFGGVLAYALSTREGRAIDSILNNNSAIRVALQAQATTGRVTAVAVPGDTRMVLLAQLPPLNPNQQYQLWFIEGQNILSGGVFAPAQTERRLLVEVPSPTQEYTLGLTIEPAGGSPQPTSSPIFVGKLPPLKSS